jgi:hypothetical protein
MNQIVAVTTEDEEPVTREEIAEYRKMKPILRQIVAEWPVLRGADGCPAMNFILDAK